MRKIWTFAVAVLATTFLFAGCGGGGGAGAPPATVYPAHANDTGVSTCGGSIINNSSCPLTNFPGQDGALGRDAVAATNDNADGKLGFSFTKLDASGNALPAAATTWSCVRDEVTGLVWETKTTGTDLHSAASTFTWGNYANFGTCFDIGTCNTDAFAAAVNVYGLCGYSDWRLPRAEELQSLADYSTAALGSAIDASYFPNLDPNSVATAYWSGSAAAGDSSFAWQVNFYSGAVASHFVSTPIHARLVRGGTSAGGTTTVKGTQSCDALRQATAPDTRYSHSGDAYVIDTQTGLMWTRCPVGYVFDDNGTPTDWSDDACTPSSTSTFTWQGALQQVVVINSGGTPSNWRLPNVKEMGTLAEHKCSGDARNMTAFPVTAVGNVWTSTPYAPTGTSAWYYDLHWGITAAGAKTGTYGAYLVRDAD